MGSQETATLARSTLGSYRLFAELGRDPLGTQYLACPAGAQSFPKWAVVRVLHPAVARDPAMARAFLAGTQAQVRMVHRNLATTFDFGGKTAQPWAAREHLIGVSIVELIARLSATRAKVPWSLASYLVSEAAEGVSILRGRTPAYGVPLGFLSGSVAPSLFVTQAGEVKIVDGCLPLVEGGPLVDSRALPYLPKGAAHANHADVFGLGAVLWELVAGRRLFAGGNDEETSRLVEMQVIPPLRTLARAPIAFDELVLRALGREVAGRLPVMSASELATELREGLMSQGERAQPSDLASLVAGAAPAELSQQNDAIARAWTVEQELQERGDLPDPASESDLTRPNGATMLETTTETAIAPRPVRRRAPAPASFDDMPTVPRSEQASTVSWRPESSAAPSSVPDARELSEPEAPLPAPAHEPAPEPLAAPHHEPAVIVAPTPFPPPRTERAAWGPPHIQLPPVDRGPMAQPSVSPPLVPAPPLPAYPRATVSPLLVGALSFALVSAGVLLFILALRPAAEPTDVAAPTGSVVSVPVVPRAPAKAPRAVDGSWTSLAPTAPSSSVGTPDSPRAPVMLPTVRPRAPSRPTPLSRSGG